MDIHLVDFYARLVVIAAVVLLGFLLGRLKWISERTNKDLVNLLLMVFMPAALFSAFSPDHSDDTVGLFFSGLLAGVVVLTSLALLSRIIFNKHFIKGEARFESQFALIFNNATFLGYPIVATTFGPAGLIPYSGFIIAFNLALFSYGVFLFERKLSWKLVRETLTNPNIIAVLLGLIVYLTHFRLPGPISDSISTVAAVMTPLSLICIGYMLSHANFIAAIKKLHLTATAIIQLIVGPIVTYLILSLLRFPAEVITICTLIQALPTATSLALFAKKYEGNHVQASELVSISTILSAVTLPFIIWLLLS